MFFTAKKAKKIRDRKIAEESSKLGIDYFFYNISVCDSIINNSFYKYILFGHFLLFIIIEKSYGLSVYP